MKLFVTGVCGQLGHDVVAECLKRNYEVIGSDIQDEYLFKYNDNFYTNYKYLPLDITDNDKTYKIIVKTKPDAIIHCAAWTNVDSAEENILLVDKINHLATKNIAKAAKDIDSKMLFVSTDYVFNGQGQQPWKADDHIHTTPVNVYGKSKLDGELSVSSILDKFFVVRTAWAFGTSGNNFVKTMLRLGKEHKTLRVVNDQIGTPTYTLDLARLLVDMVETNKYGYYHATNEGSYISWYDFAKEIFKQTNYNTVVVPVTSEEYGLAKAKRPKNSRLEKNRLIENGFEPLPDWKNALGRYLDELRIEGLIK